MSTDKQIVLVAGATGQQGSAVVRHLGACGFRVRALTRNPQSAKAQPLSRMGVEVVQGDLTDRASLDRVLEGIWGVFSVATPFEAGMEAEVAQGKTLGDAAKAAGHWAARRSIEGGAPAA